MKPSLRKRVHLSRMFRAALLITCLSPVASGEDWLRFRGPNGSGIAENEKATATSFDEKNLAWEIDLPGSGVSSPITVGEKLFVTIYSGYGEPADDNATLKDLVRSILCLNAKTGETIWRHDIPAALPEDQYDGMGIPAHGYASHTPTSDGELVFAFFGKSGVYAWDLDGNEKWHVNVGSDSDPRRWGSSSSPIMVDELVVVTAGPESRAIVGLDKRTGEEKWKASSDDFGNVWGTPVAVRTDAAATQVIIGAPYEIWSIDASTGKLRWYSTAIETDQFNSSVVADDQTIYAIEGRGGGAIAVSADGKGDVSKNKVLWTENHRGRFATPISYQGHLYNLSGGIVSCINTSDGKEVYLKRLPTIEQAPSDGGRSGRGRGMGGDYSSPVLVDGKILYISSSGVLHVIAASPEYQHLGASQIGSGETFGATPAISDGAVYLRSNKRLYKYRLN